MKCFPSILKFLKNKPFQTSSPEIMDKTPVSSFLRFARAYAAECLPWFAPALFATKIHLTEKVPVAAIDQHLNIYFNPKKIEKIRDATSDLNGLKQVGFLWIHEISHILREHGSRAAERSADPEIWNIAADMEINDSNWEGLEPPELYPGIFPRHYKMVNGELAEIYYQLLTEKKESEIEKGMAKAMEAIREENEKAETENKTSAKDEKDSGTDEPEASGDDNDGESERDDNDEESNDAPGDNATDEAAEEEGANPSNEQEESSDTEGEEEETDEDSPGEGGADSSEADEDNAGDEPTQGEAGDSAEDGDGNPEKSIREQYAEMMDEGSGVHNESREWEANTDGAERQELDDLETEQVRMAVAQEMEAQLKAGNLPAGWERWANLKLNPQVDWRKVLRHRLSRSINYSVGARTDYSFLRPSRRQAVYDPLLPPALSGNITGQIACVVDTSASITDQQLTKILGEVWAILKTFNLPVTLIPCDAEPYDPIPLRQATDIHKVKHIPGGGGTNMIKGIEAALELKEKPDVVIVLTDGYTPYPKKLYKTPVLFGIYIPDLTRTNMLPGPPWREDLIIKITME